MACIKWECYHLDCNLFLSSTREAKEKLSKLMSSLSRLHWHNKCVELHFGFKSSSKWQIQSPMVKVLQRRRRVCPRPSIKLSLLSDEAQTQASYNSFSLSSSAPHFPSNSSYFFLCKRLLPSVCLCNLATEDVQGPYEKPWDWVGLGKDHEKFCDFNYNFQIHSQVNCNSYQRHNSSILGHFNVHNY